MKYLSGSIYALLLLCLLVAGATQNDLYKDLGSNTEIGPVAEPSSGMDAMWDTWYYHDISAETGSAFMLGCEFADGHWYVTGGGASTQVIDDNVVYILEPDGTCINSFLQPATDGWGWRDLAYDGQYLYGSGDSLIYAFDYEGNLVPDHFIEGPYILNRGLAYDPLTDHFWTSQITGELCEIDRDGNIIWSGSASITGLYGLAWDDCYTYPDRLWLYAQTGNPMTTILEYDPVNHVLTGLTYTIPLLPGCTYQTAGGLCLTNEWVTSYKWTFGCVAQADPGDMLCMVEAHSGASCPPELLISLDPSTPPIMIPYTGGTIAYELMVENWMSSPLTTDVWIEVELPNQSTVEVGHREVTLLPYMPVTRNLTLTIPAGAPTGFYLVKGKIGDYPTIPQGLSVFLFYKQEVTGDIAEGSKAEIILSGLDNWQTANLTEALSRPVTAIDILPNPFNPSTVVSFTLQAARNVNLAVYDISGRKVAGLVDGWRDVGQHEVTFDGTGLASGIYLYRLQAGEFTAQGKMVLVK